MIIGKKTPFLATGARFDSTRRAGKGEKIRISLKLFLAAVILFSLIFFFLGLDWNALAFSEKETKDQVLISEESLKAQFQTMEEALIRKGSYVYSSALPAGGQGYGFLNWDNEIDEGWGGQERLTGNILIQGIAFLGPAMPTSNISSFYPFNRQRSGVITYEVQSGDTPSYIAASFGISTNTVLWANNLSYWSIIKPGQELVILPTSGVLHKVKKGETLSKIVKEYKGDTEKAIAFNGLPADGSVQSDQEIIIPGGKKAVYYYSQPTVQYASYYNGPYSGKSRSFPWGQCTWYVAQKTYVPWSGHAKSWLANARQYGFQTGSEPVAGAIMATSESWYGHVAYVEAVNGDRVTISEMHGVPYWKRGKLLTRTLNKNDWRIRGYIY